MAHGMFVFQSCAGGKQAMVYRYFATLFSPKAAKYTSPPPTTLSSLLLFFITQCIHSSADENTLFFGSLLSFGYLNKLSFHVVNDFNLVIFGSFCAKTCICVCLPACVYNNVFPVCKCTVETLSTLILFFSCL